MTKLMTSCVTRRNVGIMKLKKATINNRARANLAVLSNNPKGKENLVVQNLNDRISFFLQDGAANADNLEFFKSPTQTNTLELSELKKRNVFLNTTTLANYLKSLKGETENTIDIEKSLQFLSTHKENLNTCSKELAENTMNYFNDKKTLVKLDKISNKYVELSKDSYLRNKLKDLLTQIITTREIEAQSSIINQHHLHSTTQSNATKEDNNIHRNAIKRNLEGKDKPQKRILLTRSKNFYGLLSPEGILELFGGNATNLLSTNTALPTSENQEPNIELNSSPTHK